MGKKQDPWEPPQHAELAEVVYTGDRVAALEAMRNALAEEIDRIRQSSKHMETPGRDVATMTRELSRVMAEIAELSVGTEVDAIDEISKRRQERRARRSDSEAL